MDIPLDRKRAVMNLYHGLDCTCGVSLAFLFALKHEPANQPEPPAFFPSTDATPLRMYAGSRSNISQTFSKQKSEFQSSSSIQSFASLNSIFRFRSWAWRYFWKEIKASSKMASISFFPAPGEFAAEMFVNIGQEELYPAETMKPLFLLLLLVKVCT